MLQKVDFSPQIDLGDDYFTPDLRMVVISDTHGNFSALDVPPGDFLVHCGDFTLEEENLEEAQAFLRWMNRQPHRNKVAVPGNHDYCFERQFDDLRGEIRGVNLLIDSGVTLDGFNFYGAPWTPRFNNMAFNLDPGPDMRAKWSLIPEDTDLLVTHSPPAGWVDSDKSVSYGDTELRSRVDVVNPKAHLCGHVHSAAGVDFNGVTLFANCALVDQRLTVRRRPTVIDFKDGEIRAVGHFVNPTTHKLHRAWENRPE